MTVESLRTPQAPGNAPFRPLQGAGGGPQGVSTASKPTGCAIPAPSKIYAKEAAAHAAEQMP